MVLLVRTISHEAAGIRRTENDNGENSQQSRFDVIGK